MIFCPGAVMMSDIKIFGIGLSRTGTTSCHCLMSRFGFSAVHYPSSFREIHDHVFSNDSPVSGRFEELDRLYPHSLFIYSTREVEKWAQSCLKLFSSEKRLRSILSFSKDQKKWYDYGDMNLYGRDLAGMKDIGRDELKTAYHRHEERVSRYFENKKARLLTIDFTDRASLPLSSLVRFLEKNGVMGMPHVNKGRDGYMSPYLKTGMARDTIS
ncbi:hypothetical protein EPICR_40224 [Candidatus Desulfarcum epimagneticum]|uniref:Sulfotransferase family protein n=1 Tax=uncultured Desulfobacteraceae bacterium TaxID=218296 RepID=A0A484HH97_9BACT|nr:hypothetical protein EPICR_40224 [uncultured Desulfobacteraceae bacterium]